MRKKVLQVLIYCIIVSLILLLVIYSISRIREKKIVEENIQTFPSFCASSIINNIEICSDSLPNVPVLLMFMYPDCDFCQEEINQLKKNQNKLQNISILLITAAPQEQAENFYINQELTQITNLHFLSDTEMKITELFNVNIIPSIFLYDKNKKLTQNFKGEIKVEALLKYLSE
ncbi:MAG: Thiol-disulfide oxidoreductase ResA [Candidatus Ordinivivax streblomastigis]|uniref:Thiol-disulfide oxidoreductase ResA n=1 Tax=Candidatus Ordinivivax streblomastigis TaxID=2540710 RepID=A0A5M8P4Z5_9BACT|nr:MAG: Thiol-disulfide oxidoreductase ResA [Candidatus Ordinivivax streblomastigis]